jgi:hypothetical protein
MGEAMILDPTRDPSPERDPSDAVDGSGPDPGEAAPETPERPLFQHPQWMVGVVLIFAVLAIVAGMENPVWWLIGSPCILVLAVYLWVRLVRG